MAAYKAELDKPPFGHKEQDSDHVLAKADDASCHHRIRSLPFHMLDLKHLDKILDLRWHLRWHLRWRLNAYGDASDVRRLHGAHDSLRSKLALDTQDNTDEPGMDMASYDDDNMAGLDNIGLIPVKLAMPAPFAADMDTSPAYNDHNQNKDHMVHDDGADDDARYFQPLPLPLPLPYLAFAGS